MKKLMILAALTFAFASISSVYACSELEDGARVSGDTKTSTSTTTEESVDAESSEK